MRRTRRLGERLNRIGDRVRNIPIPEETVANAYERFAASGELPEHDRLAQAVIDKALQPPAPPVRSLAEHAEHFRGLLDRLRNSLDGQGHAPQPELRRALFHEAMVDLEPVRIAARFMIQALVRSGRDVTDPDFLPAEVGTPEFGSLALHLMGFPEILVRAPYEDQAQLLIDRLRDVRQAIPEDDPHWTAQVPGACRAFVEDGQVADDPLLREAVMVLVEINALSRCLIGEGDRSVLRAFHRYAQASPNKRATSLRRLQCLARDGRIS